MRKLFAAGLASILMLGACTSAVNVYQYQYEASLDEVFIKQGVDFTRYRAVIIDDVSVWYPKRHAPTPDQVAQAREDLARAQRLFRETIRDALGDHYSVTDRKGKGVLRMQVEFVDLRMLRMDAEIPAELRRYTFKVMPGHITMVGRLLDSQTGELLARASDLGKKRAEGAAPVDWDAISYDFQYWAAIFREWMDRVHGAG
jgi:hypothetical protein